MSPPATTHRHRLQRRRRLQHRLHRNRRHRRRHTMLPDTKANVYTARWTTKSGDRAELEGRHAPTRKACYPCCWRSAAYKRHLGDEFRRTTPLPSYWYTPRTSFHSRSRTPERALPFPRTSFREAVPKECSGLEATGTSDSGLQPAEANVISAKWRFMLKSAERGTAVKATARLVATIQNSVNGKASVYLRPTHPPHLRLVSVCCLRLGLNLSWTCIILIRSKRLYNLRLRRKFSPPTAGLW